MAYYPRLRDMREDHDLTQQKLAEYLGMPQPQYFRYEQGLRDIPTDILIQLAKLYNTTTDYLLGLTDATRSVPSLRTGRMPPGAPSAGSAHSPCWRGSPSRSSPPPCPSTRPDFRRSR